MIQRTLALACTLSRVARTGRGRLSFLPLFAPGHPGHSPPPRAKAPRDGVRSDGARDSPRRLGRAAARLLPLVVGGLLLVALRKQLPDAVHGVAHAQPVALLALVLFFAWNQVATLAWRALLRATGAGEPPLRELVRLRIEAQAVNQLVPAAGVAGEALRAVRAAGPDGIARAALATALDNVAGTIAGLGFALPVGLMAFGSRTRAFRGDTGAGLLAVGLSLVLLVVATVLPLRFGPSWLTRVSPTSRVRKLLAPLEDRSLPVGRAFGHAVLLRLGERVLAVGEVYVVFRAVGAPITLLDAAAVSALLVIVSFTVFFVPGQLGAAEAATAAAGAFLGFPPALGLSAALLRRARQLFVCLLGVTSLFVRRRGTHLDEVSARGGSAP